jgi:hypothetical protein
VKSLVESSDFPINMANRAAVFFRSFSSFIVEQRRV